MQFLEKPCNSFGKHRDIKLVITEKRRNYLVSEPNYHNTKFFLENLLAIEMSKLQHTWLNFDSVNTRTE